MPLQRRPYSSPRVELADGSQATPRAKAQSAAVAAAAKVALQSPVGGGGGRKVLVNGKEWRLPQSHLCDPLKDRNYRRAAEADRLRIVATFLEDEVLDEADSVDNEEQHSEAPGNTAGASGGIAGGLGGEAPRGEAAHGEGGQGDGGEFSGSASAATAVALGSSADADGAGVGGAPVWRSQRRTSAAGARMGPLSSGGPRVVPSGSSSVASAEPQGARRAEPAGLYGHGLWSEPKVVAATGGVAATSWPQSSAGHPALLPWLNQVAGLGGAAEAVAERHHRIMAAINRDAYQKLRQVERHVTYWDESGQIQAGLGGGRPARERAGPADRGGGESIAHGGDVESSAGASDVECREVPGPLDPIMSRQASPSEEDGE